VTRIRLRGVALNRRVVLLAAVASLALASCQWWPFLSLAEPVASWTWADGGLETGLNVDPSESAHYPQLTPAGETLYLTWFESRDGVSQVRLASLDEPGAEWQMLDGGGGVGLNAAPDSDAEWSRVVIHNGDPVISWQEWTPGAASYRIRIARSTPDGPPYRSFIDSDGLYATSGYNAIHAALASHSDRLYAAWREQQPGGTYHIRVAGYSADWEFVDQGDAGVNADPNTDAYYPKLTVHGETLFIAWHEKYDGARTLRVARRDSSGPEGWTRISPEPGGLAWDYAAMTDSPQILSARNSLLALWTERSPAGPARLRMAELPDGSETWRFLDGDDSAGLARDPAESVRWARATLVEAGTARDQSQWAVLAWAEGTEAEDVVHVAGRRIWAPESEALEAAQGNDPWVWLSPVEGLSFPGGGDVEYPHTSVVAGDLYVTWAQRMDQTFRIRVARANLRWQ
jgi:hypothetical protein